MTRPSTPICWVNSGRRRKSQPLCPTALSLGLTRIQALRYGENSHQMAGLYAARSDESPLGGELLGGKDLSYNNLLDLDAAWRAAGAYETPTVVIVKHLTPVRHRHRGDRGGGVSAGAGIRPGVGIWRGDCRQSCGGRGVCAGNGIAVCRSDCRPGFFARGTPDAWRTTQELPHAAKSRRVDPVPCLKCAACCTVIWSSSGTWAILRVRTGRLFPAPPDVG